MKIAADGDPADVIARVEVRHEQLQRRVRIATRRRHVLEDGIEQGPQILPFAVLIRRRRALPGVRVEHRKLQLVFGRIEIDEQVVDLVQHFLGARVRAIDLVDDDNGRQPPFQRLPQDEPGLRERAFRRVDQQHHAVDHRQRSFHLAAEIRVARRVDDVDEDVLVVNGGVLRHDGDPALALEIVAVHRALGDALVGAERAALMKERIDQCGLAVVDVRDDGDIPPGRIGYRHLTSIPA